LKGGLDGAELYFWSCMIWCCRCCSGRQGQVQADTWECIVFFLLSETTRDSGWNGRTTGGYERVASNSSKQDTFRCQKGECVLGGTRTCGSNLARRKAKKPIYCSQIVGRKLVCQLQTFATFRLNNTEYSTSEMRTGTFTPCASVIHPWICFARVSASRRAPQSA
jgi:hypothetical protein